MPMSMQEALEGLDFDAREALSIESCNLTEAALREYLALEGIAPEQFEANLARAHAHLDRSRRPRSASNKGQRVDARPASPERARAACTRRLGRTSSSHQTTSAHRPPSTRALSGGWLAVGIRRRATAALLVVALGMAVLLVTSYLRTGTGSTSPGREVAEAAPPTTVVPRPTESASPPPTTTVQPPGTKVAPDPGPGPAPAAAGGPPVDLCPSGRADSSDVHVSAFALNNGSSLSLCSAVGIYEDPYSQQLSEDLSQVRVLRNYLAQVGASLSVVMTTQFDSGGDDRYYVWAEYPSDLSTDSDGRLIVSDQLQGVTVTIHIDVHVDG
jgi:hypothetical protein